MKTTITLRIDTPAIFTRQEIAEYVVDALRCYPGAFEVDDERFDLFRDNITAEYTEDNERKSYVSKAMGST